MPIAVLIGAVLGWNHQRVWSILCKDVPRIYQKARPEVHEWLLSLKDSRCFSWCARKCKSIHRHPLFYCEQVVALLVVLLGGWIGYRSAWMLDYVDLLLSGKIVDSSVNRIAAPVWGLSCFALVYMACYYKRWNGIARMRCSKSQLKRKAELFLLRMFFSRIVVSTCCMPLITIGGLALQIIGVFYIFVSMALAVCFFAWLACVAVLKEFPALLLRTGHWPCTVATMVVTMSIGFSVSLGESPAYVVWLLALAAGALSGLATRGLRPVLGWFMESPTGEKLELFNYGATIDRFVEFIFRPVSFLVP